MRGMDFELDQLLNPAAVFEHPRDVLNDPDLSTQEKRAILSSWASDACAVNEMPSLRQPPGSKRPVSFDEIVDALRSLDDDPDRPRPGGLAMRLKRRRRQGDDRLRLQLRFSVENEEAPFGMCQKTLHVAELDT